MRIIEYVTYQFLVLASINLIIYFDLIDSCDLNWKLLFSLNKIDYHKFLILSQLSPNILFFFLFSIYFLLIFINLRIIFKSINYSLTF
jgi:hypothetical protein